MTQTLERLLANRQHGTIRKEILHGREHVVVPMTLMVPGVLNGSRGPLLYPIEEITRNYQAWNDVPITVNHPMDDAGEPISASEAGVLDKVGIGVVRKAVCNGKLKAEGWLDVEKTRRVNPQILNSIEAGKPVELSTGLFTDQEQVAGTHTDGRGYQFIARNYRPDHLAILPDQIGACSLRDGCGVLINRDADQPVTDEEFARFIAVLVNADCGIGGQGFERGNKCGKKTAGSKAAGRAAARKGRMGKRAHPSGKTRQPVSSPKASGKGYGKRADGTEKGSGYFGELKMKDGSGSVATEISIGVELDGKETEIPTLVPTLDAKEKDWLLKGGDPNDRSEMGERISQKAIQHAKDRKAAGKSIFANANPHGCNQHTGPDCGPGGKNDLGKGKGKAKGKRGAGTKEAPKGRAPKAKPASKKPSKAKPKGQGKDDGQLKRAEERMKGKAEPKAKTKPVKMIKDEDNTEPFAKLDREEPTPEQEKAFFGYEIPTAQIVDDGPEEPEVVEDKPAPMKVERSYGDPSRDKELDKFLAGLEKETATMKAKAGFGSKILKKIKGFFTGNAELTPEQEQWLIANGWVTLDSGTRIKLGEGGEVEAGPKGLEGKDLDDAADSDRRRNEADERYEKSFKEDRRPSKAQADRAKKMLKHVNEQKAVNDLERQGHGKKELSDAEKADKERGERVRGRERAKTRADLADLDKQLAEIKQADKDSKSYFGKGVLDKLSSFIGKFKGGNDYAKAGRALRLGATKMGRKVGQYARTAEKLLDKLTGNEEGEVPDEVFADFLLNADGGFDSDEQRMAFFGRLKGGDAGAKTAGLTKKAAAGDRKARSELRKEVGAKQAKKMIDDERRIAKRQSSDKQKKPPMYSLPSHKQKMTDEEKKNFDTVGFLTGTADAADAAKEVLKAKEEGASKKAPTAADYLKLQNDARAREESQGKTALQKVKKRMTGK